MNTYKKMLTSGRLFLTNINTPKEKLVTAHLSDGDIVILKMVER